MKTFLRIDGLSFLHYFVIFVFDKIQRKRIYEIIIIYHFWSIHSCIHLFNVEIVRGIFLWESCFLKIAYCFSLSTLSCIKFFFLRTIIPQKMIECWHPNQRKWNLVIIYACVQLFMFFKYYFANSFKMDKWCGVPQSWRYFVINQLENQMTSMAPTFLADFIMLNCDLGCFPSWLFEMFSIQILQCI
jgi:hypothetical protein